MKDEYQNSSNDSFITQTVSKKTVFPNTEGQMCHSVEKTKTVDFTITPSTVADIPSYIMGLDLKMVHTVKDLPSYVKGIRTN